MKYAVGVGSEGWKPGITIDVQHSLFDSNGNPNSDIIGHSGYSVGVLQWDFGQRNSKEYFDGYVSFVLGLNASPEYQALSQADQQAINHALALTGRSAKK